MTDASEVQIIYDDTVDVTNHAVVEQAKFTSASNAAPGDAEVWMRDPDRELSFTTGRRLKCIVDGQQLWSGFAMVNGRTSFFPAGDGREDTKARLFRLKGIDNNLLADARDLRNPADYLSAPPNVTVDRMDGWLLRYALANYFDMPGWLDITTHVDDVVVPAGESISASQPWAWQQQGSKLRATADDLAQWSSAVWYIGPDDAVHYHAIQNVECPWGLSDRPNHAPISGLTGFDGSYIGMREIDAEEDGMDLVTDAMVWGGSPFAGAGSTVFKRAVDPALETLHGKWQLAEQHFDETNFKTLPTVTQRANMIVFGNPTGTGGGSEPGSVPGEGPRGLRFPQWSYQFGWNSVDVPRFSGVQRHLYPGDLVPIQLWMFSEDGGVTPFTKFLPLRSLEMSFKAARGGKAYVFFRGSFDLRNTDSKYLWKYLLARAPKVVSSTVAVTTSTSTSTITGSIGQFAPVESPDGSRTLFTLPFGYIPGTTIVSVDGIDQQVGATPVAPADYAETDPAAGTITFTGPPATGEHIWVVDRTVA